MINLRKEICDDIRAGGRHLIGLPDLRHYFLRNVAEISYYQVNNMIWLELYELYEL